MTEVAVLKPNTISNELLLYNSKASIVSCPNRNKVENEKKSSEIQLQSSNSISKVVSYSSVSNDIFQRISHIACNILSYSIPNIFETIVYNDSMGTRNIQVYTNSGLLIREKILHFYMFMCKQTSFTLAELIFSIIYLGRITAKELQKNPNDPNKLVTEANIGTLFLCSLLISVKMNRDVVFRNSWWTKVLGIPLEVVNQSEIVFLIILDYNLLIEEAEFKKFLSLLY